MSFLPCPRCATPIVAAASGCPHCGASLPAATEVRPSALVLVGLLAGCEEVKETEAQPAYGVAIDTGYTDDDGDGYAEVDGDCDDTDDAIHPDAEETAGDGVDSNCDGADDT